MSETITERTIFAEIEIKASPERVFDAWTTPDEMVAWWGEEGKYRVTKWQGDLRPGGKWRSDGVMADGSPFAVQGEYIAVDRPNALSFTWEPDWEPGSTTTVEIQIVPTAGGTLLKVRHTGFATDVAKQNHELGWARVFGWLSKYLSS